MLVVTTRAEGHNSGCLVGFATQASIDPARFLVGLSRTNHTFGVASRSNHLAVHVLSRRDTSLAELFGGQTDDEVDKFEHCAWHSGPEGMPILDDALAWLVGRTVDRIDLGDHLGYLLEPVEAWFADGPADVIRFSDVRDLQPGHDP
ncbi:MAG: flavin reductase [Mycobacterium sp.]|uniref:flavin reductase family protein n=1 Tax=Mycobacterium sp. TaxID=1785 RepID=UPI001EC021C9|nr:flavin reductase family protein [Mycobacterium sp.]MBW0019491.1 flavin reductase [Mycobacterium sp.]